MHSILKSISQSNYITLYLKIQNILYSINTAVNITWQENNGMLTNIILNPHNIKILLGWHPCWLSARNIVLVCCHLYQLQPKSQLYNSLTLSLQPLVIPPCQILHSLKHIVLINYWLMLLNIRYEVEKKQVNDIT
jgi:hypothetical protein